MYQALFFFPLEPKKQQKKKKKKKTPDRRLQLTRKKGTGSTQKTHVHVIKKCMVTTCEESARVGVYVRNVLARNTCVEKCMYTCR